MHYEEEEQKVCMVSLMYVLVRGCEADTPIQDTPHYCCIDAAGKTLTDLLLYYLVVC